VLQTESSVAIYNFTSYRVANCYDNGMEAAAACASVQLREYPTENLSKILPIAA
jgi:hypothetical protein